MNAFYFSCNVYTYLDMTDSFILFPSRFGFQLAEPHRTSFQHLSYIPVLFCPLLSLCVPPEAGSRSGSPGRVLTSTALSTLSSGAHRVLAGSTGDKNRRSRIPRSQGCSRDSSPTRLSVGKQTVTVGVRLIIVFFCICFCTTAQM